MQTLKLIHSRKRRTPLPTRRAVDCVEENISFCEERTRLGFPTMTVRELDWVDSSWPYETGAFFRRMSISARREFELLATRIQCMPSKLLIAEEQKPFNILFLLEGEANISMTSLNGRQFLLGVAGAGEILGLASAISGDSSEIRVVARHPCKIAFLRRQNFLDFLLHHPSVSSDIAIELSLLCKRISERLRIFGLTTSVAARLASLLLEWCRDGHQTENGIQIRFVLTQGEIGDSIGSSRETITRIMTDFKSQDLVRVHGATLLVPSRRALAIYAGLDSESDGHKPAQ
jgi:CRP/FNR family transcriptional regulator, cyclic AMP receptor protein